MQVRINETVVKTSTGAIEYVDIVKVTNISEALLKLKKLDYWVYGAEEEKEARIIQRRNILAERLLVLGSEGRNKKK